MVCVTDKPTEHSNLLKVLLLVHVGDVVTTTWIEKGALGAEERDCKGMCNGSCHR